MKSRKAPNVTLRPAHSRDRAFLFRLFQESRPASAALPAADRADDSLRAEYAELRRNNASRFPSGFEWLIEYGGRRAGRIWTQLSPAELRAIDLTIHPKYQGRGIGTVVLRLLQEQARWNGVVFRISVPKDNLQVRALYERRHFEVIYRDSASFEMEWRPEIIRRGRVLPVLPLNAATAAYTPPPAL